MKNKCCHTCLPQFALTLSTLILSLLIPISVRAIEVAQAPLPNLSPNLPTDLPPPQDIRPPTSEPPPQLQNPLPSTLRENPLPNIPTPQQERAPEAEFPENFPITVTRFEFVGSKVFKDEELLKVIENALNCEDGSDPNTARLREIKGKTVSNVFAY
ncbi:hypothetical protein WA1_27230 [Scytonema hofmannii PCC 7110]|uniref:Uncharacterized protein n=1 Tax=Scytonema hofmannii PCC 7110 TaxID=128403 RepID=A0A139X6I3_9CYAN|nr:hypothetical protein [Scytonema hofmannii]KYC40232.1 hypothetical protein WA1_27230 [Scytonema hofmannii PCC 7110]